MNCATMMMRRIMESEAVMKAPVNHEVNTRKVLSFKAVIVMTCNGAPPDLRAVHEAMQKAGLTFAMPAHAEAPIVISFNDEKGA